MVDPTLISAIAGGLGMLGVKQFISWGLGRGKVKVDEATAIRIELRAEIVRKDKELAEFKAGSEIELTKLRKRVATIEDESDAREREYLKAEREFQQAELKFRLYKVDMYRTLMENKVPQSVLDHLKLLDM